MVTLIWVLSYNALVRIKTSGERSYAMETIFLSIAVGAMRDVVQLGRDASRDASKTFLGSLFRTTGTSSSKLGLADTFRTEILEKKKALENLDDDTNIYLQIKRILNTLKT